MKTYNEMAESVLRRVEAYEAEKQERRRQVKRAVIPLAALCILAAAVIGIWQSGALKTDLPVEPIAPTTESLAGGGTTVMVPSSSETAVVTTTVIDPATSESSQESETTQATTVTTTIASSDATTTTTTAPTTATVPTTVTAPTTAMATTAPVTTVPFTDNPLDNSEFPFNMMYSTAGTTTQRLFTSTTAAGLPTSPSSATTNAASGYSRSEYYYGSGSTTLDIEDLSKADPTETRLSGYPSNIGKSDPSTSRTYVYSHHYVDCTFDRIGQKGISLFESLNPCTAPAFLGYQIDEMKESKSGRRFYAVIYHFVDGWIRVDEKDAYHEDSLSDLAVSDGWDRYQYRRNTGEEVQTEIYPYRITEDGDLQIICRCSGGICTASFPGDTNLDWICGILFDLLP